MFINFICKGCIVLSLTCLFSKPIHGCLSDHADVANRPGMSEVAREDIDFHNLDHIVDALRDRTAPYQKFLVRRIFDRLDFRGRRALYDSLIRTLDTFEGNRVSLDGSFLNILSNLLARGLSMEMAVSDAFCMSADQNVEGNQAPPQNLPFGFGCY